MQFTYKAYCGLLKTLQDCGYQICNYHNYELTSRCAILRHDIDNSLEKAMEFAVLEEQAGVASTYFVLLTSDFYNVASRGSLEKLHSIQKMGHEVGLHFDEKTYSACTAEETVQHILHEKKILSEILETEVTTVSMHRPSKATLDANLQIPGMVNSYGKTFFRDFKYLSDSRRRWREPVEEIICSKQYSRLHILTHAFWYYETIKTLRETVEAFVRGANLQRYVQLQENITDLDQIMREDEV